MLSCGYPGELAVPFVEHHHLTGLFIKDDHHGRVVRPADVQPADILSARHGMVQHVAGDAGVDITEIAGVEVVLGQVHPLPRQRREDIPIRLDLGQVLLGQKGILEACAAMGVVPRVPCRLSHRAFEPVFGVGGGDSLEIL